jgi:hypothetical protein
MPLESLYGWFTFWSVIVILGVVLEEAPLPSKIWKLISFARENGREKTVVLVFRKRAKVAETIGFLLLVVGLLGEVRSESDIEVKNSSISQSQQDKIIALEAQLAPRTLTPAQQDEMVEALKPLAGLWVNLIVYPTDTEARIFAGQIADVLHRAGLFTPDGVHSCGRPDVNEPWGQVVTGVYISVGVRPESSVTFGKTFLALLTKDGATAKKGLLVHCMTSFGWAEVFVGVKPIPGETPYDDSHP